MIINDDLIIEIFFKDNKYLHSRTRQSWLNKNIDIYNYLINRYNDSDSLCETIYRIKYNIEIRPVCKYCGGHVNFNKCKENLFNNYCSSKCGNLDPEISKLRIQNSIKKYGEGNYNNRKKCKETCLKKYGVDNIFKTKEAQNKYKQTCLEKYGVDNSFKVKEIIDDIKIKKVNTCLEKYGVDNVAKVTEIKEKIYKTREKTWLEKYGVTHIRYLDFIKEKEYETKRKNNSFHTSKSELESYDLLKQKYPDVIHHYKDNDRYPFNCDFYIPSLDLFIECQYGQFHHSRPYLGTEEDLKDIELLKENANRICKEKNVPLSRYNIEIETWTIRDVNKRNIAKQNNLNYLEFWNIQELKNWLNNN